MTDFDTQLDYAYVSRYSCQTIRWTRVSKPNEFTDDAKKCAKVLMSIIQTFHRDLYGLFYDIDDNDAAADQINAHAAFLGDALQDYGYILATEFEKQDGELFNDSKTNGEKIKTLLSGLTNSKNDSVLNHLNNFLTLYYKVSHLRTTSSSSAKYPCTVRDMLAWLGGLPYTTVSTKIKQHCKDLIDDDKYNNDDILKTVLTNIDLRVTAACRNAYDVLTAIQGHGHGSQTADYPYAYNLLDNYKNFHYPSKAKATAGVIAGTAGALHHQIGHVPTTQPTKLRVNLGARQMASQIANQTVNQNRLFSPT
ncbi:Extracellular matrix-binding ebh, putative [Babesia ovata]|uniref:Extracellular matrix-binding ebh, putative n=1 Tax=Babesia ovata TaxID=189622 RepID=A0A2H6KJZ8_9APIC|nr:Extracellular matrix-binding ebh, putative [Babesia ovata]GBE63316.1 Extracellular matrix-binding ebh, putative [Babesia ovata]